MCPRPFRVFPANRGWTNCPGCVHNVHMTNSKRTRHNDCSHGKFKVPTCCGMEMAYSGQIGFYCLKCRNEAGFDALK